MEMDIKDLYKLFEDNNLSPNMPPAVVQQQQPKNTNIIKVGDIIVAEFKGREFRGEVNRIYEKSGIDFYDIKVGETILGVKFDSILEHYPKNRKFDQTIKKEIKKEEPSPIVKKDLKGPVIIENKVEPEKSTTNKINKTEQPKKVIEDPKKIEKEETEKNPDNAPAANENKETVKVIGKVTHYSGNLKLQEVINFLATKGIDKERCWYFIAEKSNNELHVIRNNDKGFKIQPFVLSFMQIQVKDKKMNENSGQIKIKGNNNFSIISDIPKDLYELIRNGLIVLLSK